MSSPAPLDPELLFTTLARHKVAYVLTGDLAARLQGFPWLTADADITPARDRENLKRLAAALGELNARVYTEAVPGGLAFDCSVAMMERSEMWHLVTAAGRLDIAFVPSGTEGFDDLSRDAVRFDVYGVELLAASLNDIRIARRDPRRPLTVRDVVIIREKLRSKEGS